MNKKALVFTLFLVCVSSFLAFLTIKEPDIDGNKGNIGNLLFAKTAENGLNIDKIVIKNAKMQATIYRNDKFWHIKEADDYYAGLIPINTLFQALNDAKIQSVLNLDITPNMQLDSPEDKDTETTGILIQTFSDQENKIDDIIIGTRQNGLYYARYADSSTPMLINGNFNLPQYLYQWLQQPLMMLSPQSVESVITQSETEKQMAFRPEPMAEFHNIKQQPTDIASFLEPFASLEFISVKAAENTPLKDAYPKKTIVIFLESGLIYGVEVYEADASYWIKINLSTTSLPTKLASDYINDSNFLYKDWFFEINENTGKFLVQYTIN